MDRSTLRRTGAFLCSATLLASLITATLAGPASAAKPTCQGQTATIVGTARAETIVGTAGRDVIVARGGHDRIYGKGGNDLVCAGTGDDLVVGGPGADTVWGQLGDDRLDGGPGPDFLVGQVGNDTINGGLQIDKCYQGTGTGPVVNCELPAPPVVAPPPPPAGPEPIPLAGILAVAYTDLNGNHVYDTGDVLISKLVDTNGDKVPSIGDTVVMDRYPTNLEGSSFAGWGVKSHTVTGVTTVLATHVIVASGVNASHRWYKELGGQPIDDYNEQPLSVLASEFSDSAGSFSPTDRLVTVATTQSQPTTIPLITRPTGGTDDRFIDVELIY